VSTPEANDALKAENAMRQRLLKLAETERWVHHVGDLDSEKTATAELDRPVTPLSRARRLSRLGHRFDEIAIAGPSYRLTPQRPFQASPEASMSVSHPDFYGAKDDFIAWNPPRDGGPRSVNRGIRFRFAVSPHERSVASMSLSGHAFQGTVGHIRVSTEGKAIEFPIGETFSAHTVDFTFVPFGGRLSVIGMFLLPGIRTLTFRSISFGAVPPVVFPG
jgi:hypothetical protein